MYDWHPEEKRYRELRAHISARRHRRFLRFLMNLKKWETFLSESANDLPVEGSFYEINISHPDNPTKHVKSWWNVVMTPEQHWTFLQFRKRGLDYGFRITIK